MAARECCRSFGPALGRSRITRGEQPAAFVLSAAAKPPERKRATHGGPDLLPAYWPPIEQRSGRAALGRTILRGEGAARAIPLDRAAGGDRRCVGVTLERGTRRGGHEGQRL